MFRQLTVLPKLIEAMTLDETKCFKMLDGYSRTHHRCFLAEMNLNANKGAYALCFRPAGGDRNSPNRYACRYLHIGVKDVKSAADMQVLPLSISEMLDREPPALWQL